jgi:hypothetical protein
MSAVDETGRSVAHYRRVKVPGAWTRQIEIVVDPAEHLDDVLLLLLATTANNLNSYFAQPGGGG